MVNDWYYLWGLNYLPTSNEYSYIIYPDSNLIDNTGSTIHHVSTHGLGMSFDPTDSAYSFLAQGASGGLFDMIYDQVYNIDSFFVPAVYRRNNPDTTVVDSLIIELVVTQMVGISLTPATDSGAYSLQYTTADTAFYKITYDEKPRFATAHYNRLANAFGPGNSISYDSVTTWRSGRDSSFTLRYAVALTNTNKYDTTNGEFNINQVSHRQTLPFTMFKTATGNAGAPVTLQADQRRMLSFVSFKSGVTYPLGTLATNANYIKLYAGEPNVSGSGDPIFFRQSASNMAIPYRGSYQAGLLAPNSIRYSDTGFVVANHNILVPSVSLPLPGFSVPEQAFHIRYDNGIMQGEGVVISNLTGNVKVFPNPADKEFNISVINSAYPVISITNVIGQIIAVQQLSIGENTINTAQWPEGIYIYKITSNGESVSGRIVIAH